MRRPHSARAAALTAAIAVAASLVVPARVAADGGLELALSVAQTSWTVGETVALDATLTNVGTQPMRFDLFGELDAIYEGKRRATYVVSCWALVWTSLESLPGPRRGRYTLAADQFVRLAPGESHRQRLSRTVPAVPPGRYRIKLAYVPRMAGASFSLPDRWEEQQGFTDPLWLGMAYSNEVTIAIVPAAAS
jgi:hypothetical protein